MKHLIKHSLFVLTILSLFVFSSCKEKDPETTTPCDHPISVTATDVNMHNMGHFVGNGRNLYSSFAPSQTYYFVRNWKDFESKVIPGRQYKIGFKEVDCGTCQRGCFGDEQGRCGTPILICIELICIEEITKDDCYTSYIVNPDSVYNSMYSKAVTEASIVGNTLKTKSYFSGCSLQDDVNFALELSLLPTSGPIPVFEAKVREIDRGFTCQAVFEKQTCFNLASIKDYYALVNMVMPDQVMIKFDYGDKTQDLYYSLK